MSLGWRSAAARLAEWGLLDAELGTWDHGRQTLTARAHTSLPGLSTTDQDDVSSGRQMGLTKMELTRSAWMRLFSLCSTIVRLSGFTLTSHESASMT